MKVEIKFKVDVPDVGATEQEIEDWLRFSFGDNGQIDGLNPLLNQHGNANGYAWTLKTDIPHEVFAIMEDGAAFSRGIVFALSDLERAASDA